MERCPNEILEYICTYACTDDGFTGRSLSLVSRRIHDGSYRHVLRSVALYGPHQLSAFADHLIRRTPEDRHVHHLYLVDRPRKVIENIPGQDQIKGKAANERMDSVTRAKTSEAIASILRIVAPQLRTLGVVLFERYPSNIFTTIPLLHLEELTIQSSSLELPPESQILQYSTLRRLHVISNSPEWTDKDIAALAPQLTHLRCSRLKAVYVSTQGFFGGLQRMVFRLTATGRAIVDSDTDEQHPGLPSTLQRVIVQMSQPASSALNPELEMLHSLTADLVKSVAQSDWRRRIIVERPVLYHSASSIDGFDDSDYECYALARRNWEARVCGEDGTWVVRPSDVIAPTSHRGPDLTLGLDNDLQWR
ncbi:hypothetical protein FKP32DRAFT_824190 [Trametes sanguinea]|nr:hypothetical protein FKP32DRAFT_824190 [Trametes sanguinea]